MHEWPGPLLGILVLDESLDAHRLALLALIAAPVVIAARLLWPGGEAATLAAGAGYTWPTYKADTEKVPLKISRTANQ